jgi:hypothetical protein
MKRRDKGWGEADSQRAQSTSHPTQESKARVDRPARSAVHLHVYFCTRTLAVMETLLFWAKPVRDQAHTCLACLYHSTPARLEETSCPVPCRKQPSKTLPAQREAVRLAAAWVVQDG